MHPVTSLRGFHHLTLPVLSLSHPPQGYDVLAFASDGRRATGLDISDTAVAAARKVRHAGQVKGNFRAESFGVECRSAFVR